MMLKYAFSIPIQYSLLRIVLFTLCFYSSATAQRNEGEESIFRAYLGAGFNITQVAGDNLAGYRKIGANAGIGTYIMLPKNFSVGMEMAYSQKGSRISNNELFQTFTDFKLAVDYIDVPISVSFHDRHFAIFSVSLIPSLLVRYKEERGGVEFSGDNPYRPIYLEAGASVSFLFAQHFGINLKGAYSIMDARKVTTDYLNNVQGKHFHNVISVRLLYFIKSFEEK